MRDVYCRYCGGDNLEYKGIDDGCGEYGDELADIYECCDCGMQIEVTESAYGPYEDSQSESGHTDISESDN